MEKRFMRFAGNLGVKKPSLLDIARWRQVRNAAEVIRPTCDELGVEFNQ